MNFLQRLKDGANKATEKAQNMVEINKLSGEISDIESKKTSYYREMGRVFYEGYRLQDMKIAEKEMVNLARSCDVLQEQIDELRMKIATMKNERLCQCGRTVALDANFCPFCGSKLDFNLKAAPQRFSEPSEELLKDDVNSEDVTVSEKDEDPFVHGPEAASLESEAEELVYEQEDEELLHLQGEDNERERRHLEELERERERQLELDRLIRSWKENNDDQEYLPQEGVKTNMVKCQICSTDLPKGSKWCPRCGAEQI